MGRFDVEAGLLESFSVLGKEMVGVSGKERTNHAGHTAVPTSDPSVSSLAPRTDCTTRGQVRSFLDRVVSNTLNNPSLSNKTINTAARPIPARCSLDRIFREKN